MFVARLAGLIMLIALAVLGGAYVATRNRRYLDWAKRVLQLAVIFLAAFLVFYLVERLMLVI